MWFIIYFVKFILTLTNKSVCFEIYFNKSPKKRKLDPSSQFVKFHKFIIQQEKLINDFKDYLL